MRYLQVSATGKGEACPRARTWLRRSGCERKKRSSAEQRA